MTVHELPEHTPGPDLRGGAFLAAWDLIEAAAKLKIDPATKSVRDPLPELYWATLAEAAIYADLARADEQPACDAGRFLVGRDEERRRDRARIRKTVRDTVRDRLRNARGTNDVAPWADGHRVRITAGDWAGRRGTIAMVYPDNEPPMLDVELDGASTPAGFAQPMTIAVLPAHVELIGADL